MPRRSANELTPPAELVARFRRDVEAITGAAPDADRKLGLAVSGGPDSLALLLLAAAAYPGQVAAATVDHGLRPEAAAEAKFVGGICAALRVPHAVLVGTVPGGNLQQAARELRYALLAQWAQGCARYVATAHQQDDLAETFLMRARRGAGVGGLAAMCAARPLMDDTSYSSPSHPGEGRGPASANGEVRGSATARALPLGPGLCRGGIAATLHIRPLLSWSRAELQAIVTAAGIAAVYDPSNADPRFDRARIRLLLAESPDLPADRLALAARNLRHAEDALAWVAEREWQARSRANGHALWLDANGLPYELRRRLTVQAIDWVRAQEKEEQPFDKLRANGKQEDSPSAARAEPVEALSFSEPPPPPLRGESLDRLIATLEAGGTGTIAGVKAEAKRAEWRFSEAPARRSH